MAPSLPGRRSTTRGSSSSLRRENSFSKRGPRRELEDESEDDEPSTRRPSARSKRPVRKATTKVKIVDIPLEAYEDEEEEEDNDMASVATDDVASGEGDDEENEGDMDDSGEAKITMDGELLGGREYKCKSFKLPDRGDRIYMLSMDPARVLGFRDSYLFFIKNPHLARIITTSEERAWMIREGLLMPNFKNKLIAVVSARSIFKSFGARIIKNGRSKVDDYYDAGVDGSAMDDSADEGTVQGEEAKPTANGATEEAPRPGPGRKRALPKPEEPARTVTDLTWQYEGAMTVRAFNNQLKEMRKENPKFLDPHTNIEQGPSAFQPTQIHVQKVEQGDFLYTREEDATKPTVVSIPRTVGPKVDSTVRVEIKGGPPRPPLINDPNVWEAIPEEIRKALQDAEETSTEETFENRKYPISVMQGQFQSSYSV
ncbi:hypothetical protein BGZ82_009350 [Podila clonocystis]|nr:hypothetical protein BGZ82_009350 [Podila clonocystis]